MVGASWSVGRSTIARWLLRYAPILNRKRPTLPPAPPADAYPESANATPSPLSELNQLVLSRVGDLQPRVIYVIAICRRLRN
jgi:hypothetical protein